MNPGIKHALSNLPNGVTILTFVAGLIPLLLANDWVKQHSQLVIGLGLASVIVTYALQFVRDAKNPPPADDSTRIK